MSKHEPLEALARAYDREDASQRGEPDPWKGAEDDAEWVSERLACAQVAEAAYLSAARSVPEAGKAVDAPQFTLRQVGEIGFENPEDEGPITGIVLEGSIDAVRAAAKFFDEKVCVIPVSALASVPAPSGATGPVAILHVFESTACNGRKMGRLRDWESFIKSLPVGDHPIYLAPASPQAVPAEDVAK